MRDADRGAAPVGGRCFRIFLRGPRLGRNPAPQQCTRAINYLQCQEGPTCERTHLSARKTKPRVLLAGERGTSMLHWIAQRAATRAPFTVPRRLPLESGNKRRSTARIRVGLSKERSKSGGKAIQARSLTGRQRSTIQSNPITTRVDQSGREEEV